MRTIATGHPTAEQLRAFGQGRLAPEAMDTLEEHIAECAACADALRGVADDTLVELVRAAGERTQIPPTRPGPSLPARPEPTPTRSVPDVPPELVDHPRYRVLQVLGLGGMGVVYKAEHRLMERLVALKVIHRQIMQHPTAVERFCQEVKAAGRLAHANIVTAHDAEQAGELHFLAMEFVEGVSLARLVEHQGPVSIVQAASFTRQAALGLAHAHEKGMVHRDIKPQNLMVTRAGQVKILDFGLARFASEWIDPKDDAPRLRFAASNAGTRQGMILGTPDYMSPEQRRDPRTAQATADIFSLGCTLFYLLTGKPPQRLGVNFQSPECGLEASAALRSARSDAPPSLLELASRMLAFDPQARPSAQEVARELAAYSRRAKQNSAAEVASPASVAPAPVVDSRPDDDRLETLDLSAFELAADPNPLRPRSHLSQRRLGPGQQLKLMAIVLLSVAALVVGGATIAALVAAARTPGGNPTARTAGDKKSSGNQQAALAPAARPAAANAAPATKSHGQPRALILLPQEGYWNDDYLPARRVLERAGFEVQVASTARGSCRSYAAPQGLGSTGPLVTPDIVLSAATAQQNWDVVLFVGYATYEFRPGGAGGDATKSLVQDALARGNFVGALCKGQEVLAEHGFLQGHSAALNPYIDESIRSRALTRWVNDRFLDHGQIVLGKTSADAVTVASRLAEKVRQSGSK